MRSPNRFEPKRKDKMVKLEKHSLNDKKAPEKAKKRLSGAEDVDLGPLKKPTFKKAKKKAKKGRKNKTW